MATEDQDPLTNTTRPLTDAILTIRVIKSFTYRTVKNYLAKHIDLTTTTVAQLQGQVKQDIKTLPAWKAYRNVELDTLKFYTRAHGSKTTNLIINLEDDPAEWLSNPDATLASYGIENETELSFFNKALYDEYKAHPDTVWAD